MTIADQISFAKRRSRTTSNILTETYTDDVARFYIQRGVEEFCKMTHGISKENYISVSPIFDVRTNFAIRLTIVGGANALTATDIVVTAADATDINGTTLAGYLQTAIQAAGAATATVSWDTSDWFFTIDAIDSTSIIIDSPDDNAYVDATDLIFGGSGTQNDTEYTGSFPEDCTVEADLPDDFLEIEMVTWDGVTLDHGTEEMFMHPQRYGTPTTFYIRDKKIRLNPSPNSQEMFHIRYGHIPDGATLTGSSDTTTCALNLENHMAPVYYAASCIAEENFELVIAKSEMEKFLAEIDSYKIKEANQNPKLFPKRSIFRVPKVEYD